MSNSEDTEGVKKGKIIEQQIGLLGDGKKNAIFYIFVFSELQEYIRYENEDAYFALTPEI